MPTPSIVKATLSVRSDYSPAEAPDDNPNPDSGTQSWGVIGLWDIRQWLPWSSRGNIGALGWLGYHDRTALMSSSQSPLYNPGLQYPKRWYTLTKSVDIIFTGPTGVGYATCAEVGGPPYSYHGVPTASGDLAFDPTTVASFLSTLVIVAYAYNSNAPGIYPASYPGGPNDNDSLNVYIAYLDVLTSDGVTTHYIPQSWTQIDGGPLGPDAETGSNYFPGVYTGDNVLDLDAVTCATVYELNSNVGSGLVPVASMWHPYMLLLSGWTPYPPTGPAGRNHSFLGVMAMGTRPDASFVG